MADDDLAHGSRSQGVSAPPILPPAPEARPDLYAELLENLPKDRLDMRERLPRDDQEMFDRLMRASFDMRIVILDAAAGYGQMLEAGNFSDAWAWVEMLAVAWRDTEEFDLEHQFGDEFLPPEAVSLATGLEDSFVLARSEDETRRESAFDRSEVSVGIDRAGAAGMLGPWEKSAEEVYGASANTRAAKRAFEDEYKQRRRKQIDLRARVQGGMTPRHRALQLPARLEDEALVPVGVFYRQLDPDGRSVSEDARADGRRLIEDAAAVLRAVDIKRDLYDQRIYRTSIVPFISLIRTTLRSLALALSEDPARRARAAPLLEIQQRLNRYRSEAKAGQPPA